MTVGFQVGTLGTLQGRGAWFRCGSDFGVYSQSSLWEGRGGKCDLEQGPAKGHTASLACVGVNSGKCRQGQDGPGQVKPGGYSAGGRESLRIFG